jgi:hypothetical protein
MMRLLSFAGILLACLGIAFGLCVMVALLSLFSVSFAHTAPSGWSYDSSCCSTTDCRQVPASWVRETGEGYLLVKTREMLRHGDKRIKVSPDGLWHWCTTAGRDDAGTICLYVPPRGM